SARLKRLAPAYVTRQRASSQCATPVRIGLMTSLRDDTLEVSKLDRRVAVAPMMTDFMHPGPALHTQLLEHAFEDLLFQVQGLAPLVLLGFDDLFSQISHIDLERMADGIALRLGEIE